MTVATTPTREAFLKAVEAYRVAIQDRSVITGPMSDDLWRFIDRRLYAATATLESFADHFPPEGK